MQLRFKFLRGGCQITPQTLGPYTFAWSRDGVALSATGATLADVPPGGTHVYRVVVTYANGLSSTADSTVNVSSVGVSISGAPSAGVLRGLALTLGAGVTGATAPYGYAWTRDGSTFGSTATVNDTATLGTHRYELTVVDTNGCRGSATATVDGFDFSLALSPSERTQYQGGLDYQISVSLTSGSAGVPPSVALSIAQSISQVYFFPSTMSFGSSAVFQLSSAALGDHQVTVTATAGGGSRSATANIHFYYFSLDASPSTATIAQGASVTFTITPVLYPGSTSIGLPTAMPLSLTCSPLGASVVLPATIRLDQSFSVVLTIGTSTPPGPQYLCLNAGPGEALVFLDLTVTAADTLTSLSASPNPALFGQSVSFTATVTAAGGGVPSGTVQFKVDGANLGAPVVLVGGRASSANAAALAVGAHVVIASYSGTPGFNPSNGTLTATVNKADTLTALSAGPNPAVFGQSVSFAATVSAILPGAGVPSGSVQFKVDGANLGAPVVLVGGRASSSNLSTLAIGAHLITASYSGDPGFNASAASKALAVNCPGSLSFPLAVAGQDGRIITIATLLGTETTSGSHCSVQFKLVTASGFMIGTGTLTADHTAPGVVMLSAGRINLAGRALPLTFSGSLTMNGANGILKLTFTFSTGGPSRTVTELFTKIADGQFLVTSVRLS